jgi:hypothetical protein
VCVLAIFGDLELALPLRVVSSGPLAAGQWQSTGGSLLSLPWRPCSLARSSTIPCSALVVGRAREPTRSASPTWDEGVCDSLRFGAACRRWENEGTPLGDRCGGDFIRLLEEMDEGSSADGLEPLQASGGTVLVDVASVAVGSGVG